MIKHTKQCLSNYNNHYSEQPHFSFITTLKRAVQLFLTLLWFIMIFGGCAIPGSTKPVLKIGLIAPFEGELRHQAYQRLYGVKLALHELNGEGGVAGYKIALVALNDYAEEIETKQQAQVLVIDPHVQAVIGNWDQGLYQATAEIYASAQMLVLNPNQFTQYENLPPHFGRDFQALSGSLPSQEAQQAYLAAWYLIDLIERTGQEFGSIQRADILDVFNNS